MTRSTKPQPQTETSHHLANCFTREKGPFRFFLGVPEDMSVPAILLFGFQTQLCSPSLQRYNEDWLWCLMHSTISQVQVVSSGEVVTHDPPALRQSTRGDLLFELMGDVVLDSLEERSFPAPIDPETILTCLSDFPPPADSMPSPRVLELPEQSKTLEAKWTVFDSSRIRASRTCHLARNRGPGNGWHSNHEQLGLQRNHQTTISSSDTAGQ